MVRNKLYFRLNRKESQVFISVFENNFNLSDEPTVMLLVTTDQCSSVLFEMGLSVPTSVYV